MVGSLVLANCLKTENVTEVISLVRKPSGEKHAKLTELVITDFEDYSEHTKVFTSVSAAFFCLGAYTGKVPDELFKKITVDYAVVFAEALAKNSPGATFCLLSGAGADRTEKSRFSFARYKGMAENSIAGMNLKFYSFRPGYIYPVVPRDEPNIGYKIFRLIYPVFRLLGKKHSIKSTELADGMFYVGLQGADKEVLENHDIFSYTSQASF